MANEGAYILKGYGQIEPDWVCGFLALFKKCQVNIRKLVLLKDEHPACFAMLEVHFIPPTGTEHLSFLDVLDQHLATQPWVQQTLKPIQNS